MPYREHETAATQLSIDGLSNMLQTLSPVMRVQALSLCDAGVNCFARMAGVNKNVIAVRRPFDIEGHGGDNIGRFANRQLAFVELFQMIRNVVFVYKEYRRYSLIHFSYLSAPRHCERSSS